MGRRDVVVVTGGNRGIGRELVRQMALRGDTVVLGSRDPAAGRAAAAELERRNHIPDGRILPMRLDVTDPDALRAGADEIDARLGRIDVLINNAATAYDTWQTSADPDFEVVDLAWRTNVVGAWRTSVILLPLLRRSPHPRIVMVSSQGGSLAGMSGGTPAYSLTKAALNALTRTMAGDLRRDGVLVNAVCPGWTATDMGGAGGRPVSEGAASVLWAVDQPTGGPTGTFTRDGRALPW